MRREALTIRVEVKDLPPLALSQQGDEALLAVGIAMP
jgi:hypothetical protein